MSDEGKRGDPKTCEHGWADEDGCGWECDGAQQVGPFCRQHAEFHGDELVDVIDELQRELDNAHHWRGLAGCHSFEGMHATIGELIDQINELRLAISLHGHGEGSTCKMREFGCRFCHLLSRPTPGTRVDEREPK